ncbi:MAG: RNA 2',3'-cyclic phosphodiesterase [Microgenomates group bacterium]
MRLFLAIDIPENLKEKIDKQISNLKKDYPNFTWVPKENFHITLFFFGETEKIEMINKKISELIYDQESFYLHANRAGLFINKKIVIFLNFSREKKIEALAKKINKVFAPIFSQHYTSKTYKKFIPHLTIARTKIPSKQQYFQLKKKLTSFNINISFPVKEIFLYQSIIGGKKPIYKKIKSFPLL